MGMWCALQNRVEIPFGRGGIRSVSVYGHLFSPLLIGVYCKNIVGDGSENPTFAFATCKPDKEGPMVIWADPGLLVSR
jgi:hypothetical protein